VARAAAVWGGGEEGRVVDLKLELSDRGGSVEVNVMQATFPLFHEEEKKGGNSSKEIMQNVLERTGSLAIIRTLNRQHGN
jgi:hypothetical protein